ncbi:hypothetical protein [Microbispora siamensis]|uniref:LppX_LprAFG lipoprotein n=1 Tax=Microbispora siamensis TaxID=564413 RepID=A0ABQ4GQ64_9ACTN|nr:hypothetical protein [Microbispora siamensis]GIH63576.1 hypothetical protein Msi02_43930 [Microbispora siamensis]
MKRALMALACAATAALVAPAIAAPAQAQTSTQAQAPAADPVAALRKQYVAGHGVRFVSSGTLSVAGVTAIKFTANGAMAFGRSGVVASDSTQKLKYNDLLKEENEDLKDAEKPLHAIVIGSTGYLSGGVFASVLPEGKTWLRLPAQRPGSSSSLGEFLNPADWRNLKAVLATTKAKGPGGSVNGAKTTLYRGSISLAQLMKVSPGIKESFGGLGADPAKTVVSWKLWIGSDQLVRRSSASADLKMKAKGDSVTFTLSDVTTFAGWGGKVTVKAPPKSQVANLSDLDGDVPETPGTVILPNN